MIQILATVYRTVSAVSDNEALSELMRGNPVYSRAALYDSEPNVQNDLKILCMSARGDHLRGIRRKTRSFSA